MNALFTGFLSVSLSGSLILCLVMLLRFLLKKAPKALICVLWAIAFCRLLLPFQIETSFSLRPDTPVITVESAYSEEAKSIEVIEVANSPQLLPPQHFVDTGMNPWSVATFVWATGMFGMFGYAVISYFLLKKRLADSCYYDAGYYVTEKLSTAILIGYFHPEIYLPSTIDPEQAKLVVTHELAHLRRGDNWLKLFAFVVLAVHWYNPLVWAGYVLLCRDVEDACDTSVIRNLDVEGRKKYSSALLACGTQRHRYSVCPVAFGEIGVRHRILNVLHYRKPTLWICVLAIVVMIAATVFFMTDPIQEHPLYFDKVSELIGEPRQVVFDALGFSTEELSLLDDSGDNYETPIQVIYQGVPMQLVLSFSRTDILYSFGYVAYYDASDDLAEEHIVKLARHCWKAFGKGYQADAHKEPEILSYISKKTVRRTIDSYVNEGVRTHIVQDEWDLTQNSSAGIKQQLTEIGETAEWQGAYMNECWQRDGFDRTFQPHFFMDYYAYHDTTNASEDVIVVKLQYRVRTHMTSIPTYVAQFVQKQTWWDKLLFWLK